MNTTIQSAVINPVGVTLVQVEVQVSEGLPTLSIIGLADTAVYEARERVRAALKSIGVSLPPKRITVNLAPASEKKSGSSLDLAIAIGILCAIGRLRNSDFERCLCIGELSISGDLRPCIGMMAYLAYAQSRNMKLLTAVSSVSSGVAADGLTLIHRLSDVLSGMTHAIQVDVSEDDVQYHEDYSEIIGQQNAIRAAAIAIVGGHHILLVGSPGCGKTMIAQRMRSVLPPLSKHLAFEVSQIYGRFSTRFALKTNPPFREPHHSATTAGMVGGGNPFQLGEISLAHRGILFLDELPEFKPSVLQLLRQPLESGTLTHVRARESWVVPAQFLLVATANPCPCGFYGSTVRECGCSAASIRNYRNRIGGPLLDRIDIVMPLAGEHLSEINNKNQVITSAQVAEKIEKGLKFRANREAAHAHVGQGSESEYRALLREFESGARQLLAQVESGNVHSNRKVLRIMRVARTIADMSERIEVAVEDLTGATAFCAEWRVP